MKFTRFPGIVSLAAMAALFSPLALSADDGKKAGESAVAKEVDPSKEIPPGNKKKPKRPVSPKDYARWESLGATALSDDGRWFASIVSRVDKEQTLHLLDLRAKDRKKPAWSIKQGDRPAFSKDSKWLAVAIARTPAEIRKQEKEKKPSLPAGKTYKLRELKDGTTTEIKGVLSFGFSADSRFAAFEVEGVAKPGSKEPAPGGKALIVRNLRNGTDTTFGNVTKHAWSDKGALLAMVVDSPSISNTLQLFDPRRASLRTLDSSEQDYVSISWREDTMDLAVSREMEHGKDEDVSHVLIAWRNLGTVGKLRKKAMSFDHLESDGFPEEMYVSAGKPAWTKDGRGVLIDLKEWKTRPKSLDKEKPEEAADEPEKSEKKTKEPKPSDKPLRESLEADSNVEVWHAKDVEIMPLQKKRASSEENPKRRAIWWPEENRLIQLGNDLTEEVEMLRAGEQAVGLDHTPHERAAMFGPELADIYLINITTGDRKRILEGVQHTLNSSPDGAFLLYLQQGDVWSYQIASGEKRNLTSGLNTSFTNQEDDSLAKEKRPYSRGQWLADSSAVLLDDRFDIWKISPDASSSRRLTDGKSEMIRHRLSSANFTEQDDGLLDPSKPVYLGLYGDRSKKSGYARLALDDEQTLPKVLVWEDRMIGSLRRAEENSQVYIYRKESFKDSPDFFLAGPDLTKARKLTHTNSFQKEFRWGKSELINYVNENGVELQGALIYPANYRKGRKYPMVTYIYERLSQNLHRYAIPSETHPYNPAVFSAEGYFVLMPDIVYRPQEPGPSAVECIVPAVKAAIATGMVDPERVALIGHSWGAYQTAFTVTHSDLFAAAVAGAPLTNMMSMSMQIYWNTGNTNARIFGISQGRMDKPFWRDVDNFIRNSPIHGMDNLKTPLLVAFGDKDGAVDFSQGIEMYNAARLAKKENFVMLVYPGENHGLKREENQVDYHYRIIEWLAHYLKDKEAPKWITEGKSFLERKEELEAKKKEKKESEDGKK